MNANHPTETDPTPDTGPVDEHREGLAALTRSLRLGLVWLYAVVALMVGTVLAQSFFIVKQHEVGFIYRFGRLRDIVSTGLHFVWPYPVERTQVYDLSRSRALKSDSFMPDSASADGAAPATLRPGVDGSLLTADLNILHTDCALTYRVDVRNNNELRNHFLTVFDREAMLRALLDNAVLKAAAGLPAQSALMNPDLLRTGIAAVLRENTQLMSIGVSFESRDITTTTGPPRQAKAAFDALNRASQEQDRMISEAVAYRIKTESEAQSRAEAVVAEAEAERVARLADADASAVSFRQRLAQFQKNPDLVSRTIYEETLARILANVEEKFIVRKRDGRQIRIMLGRERSVRGPTADDDE